MLIAIVSRKSSCFQYNKGPVLKKTASQRTMSGLNGDLTGQGVSRLAGHVDQS